ncbi:hypothetical protein [uncultured Aquabacterium sp.]|uniref:hypothetical protein n=1 Tax=uncultured Aquabacterium sp. TaxID=158753 RepID=UPI00261A12EE|nr:hypothetical protein [uncultured Aquabacterium sp.]
MNLSKNAIACLLSLFVAGGACATGADAPPAPTQDSAATQSTAAPKAGKRPKQEVNWYTTPGWKFMSREERNAYRDKVHATKTYDECRAQVHENYQQMAERAKAAGQTLGVESDLACKRLAPKKP